MDNLSRIPEEIGDLCILLDLSLFSIQIIESLPRSIGRLRNLQKLQLYGMSKLSSIPEEIGDLSKLVEKLQAKVKEMRGHGNKA